VVLEADGGLDIAGDLKRGLKCEGTIVTTRRLVIEKSEGQALADLDHVDDRSSGLSLSLCRQPRAVRH